MPSSGPKIKKGQVIPFIQDGGFFYKKGIEAYQSKQVERATSYFERAIRLEPEEPVFMCQLAIVLSEEGNYEASNEWLAKIKNAVDPAMSECYFFMANNMAHLGELEYAKENLETYLSIDEEGEFVEDAELLLTMVNDQLEQPELDEDESEERLEKQQNLKMIGLLNSGEYVQAEKEARKQIANDSQQWNLYVYLAEALMYQNQSEEAESILQDLLLKEQPNFLAQCQMAVLLYQKGDPQASLWIDNIVDVRPMNDWNCYFLGRSLFFVGKYETAYAWYTKLLNKFSLPRLPHLYHQMAVLAWHCGDTDVSRKFWRLIEQEDPNKQAFVQELVDKLDEGQRPSTDMKQFLFR